MSKTLNIRPVLAGAGEHGADHPLLAATIGTLPPVGAGFSARARKDWLAMITMAFNVVYGPEETMGTPLETPAAASPPAALAPVATTRRPHQVAGCDVYIDEEGFVRGKGDRRVMPDEVVGEDIYRGGWRDRDTITWADGSQGAPPGTNFCGPG